MPISLTNLLNRGPVLGPSTYNNASGLQVSNDYSTYGTGGEGIFQNRGVSLPTGQYHEESTYHHQPVDGQPLGEGETVRDAYGYTGTAPDGSIVTTEQSDSSQITRQTRNDGVSLSKEAYTVAGDSCLGFKQDFDPIPGQPTSFQPREAKYVSGTECRDRFNSLLSGLEENFRGVDKEALSTKPAAASNSSKEASGKPETAGTGGQSASADTSPGSTTSKASASSSTSSSHSTASSKPR